MSEEQLLLDLREDFSLLIEAGFVAVKQLDEISATRIFQAAQALSPKNTAPQVGLGYIALNKLEIKEATKIFESVVTQEPENHLAIMFLGICFLLTKSKRTQGQQLIKDTMKKTDEPTIKNLGEVSLEWAEKDLKKLKSPFFAEKSEAEKSEPGEKTL